MAVTVLDGHPIEVRDDPAPPFTRGALCVKRVYRPDRVLHPLRRVGSNRFGKDRVRLLDGSAGHQGTFFEMKQFVKENTVLVAGVMLPPALMGLFYIAGVVTRAGVADPQYDMVFAANYVDPPWRIGLEENVLTIRYTPAANVPAGYVPPKPQLYLFDHKTMTVEPLPINYDHIVNGVVRDPVIEKLNAHILFAEYASPDGYQLANDYYSDGLFLELFGFRNNRNSTMLRKQSRNIRLAGGPPYYGTERLIVWVDGKKQ